MAKKRASKKKAAARKIGRPTKKTVAVCDEICRRIAEGETIRAIARDAHMPGFVTIYEWIKDDDALAERIARARDVGFDAIAQEAMEIADTPVEGEEREVGPEGEKIKYRDMLRHRSLRVETRLKLLAKWCPQRYGDTTKLEHSNPDGSMTPGIVVVLPPKQ